MREAWKLSGPQIGKRVEKQRREYLRRERGWSIVWSAPRVSHMNRSKASGGADIFSYYDVIASAPGRRPLMEQIKTNPPATWYYGEIGDFSVQHGLTQWADCKIVFPVEFDHQLLADKNYVIPEWVEVELPLAEGLRPTNRAVLP